LQTTTKAFLKDITDKIVDAVLPRKIVLFGSYARGEENAESDLDLLIIQDTPFVPENSRLKEMGMLWRLLADIKIPKDILIYTPDEVARWKSSLNHIIPTALREGIVLYER
jgi:predicted nucleotidyltransferase